MGDIEFPFVMDRAAREAAWFKPKVSSEEARNILGFSTAMGYFDKETLHVYGP